MHALLTTLLPLAFARCLTQCHPLEDINPTLLASRALPAQGTLFNTQLTDIFNQIDTIQMPINRPNSDPSGRGSSLQLNQTSDNYDLLITAHETDTPYGSASVETALVTTANRLTRVYQLLATGFIQKDGNGNPVYSQYQPRDVAAIRGAMTRQKPLVDQTYAILKKVVTGGNVGTITSDIQSINNAFSGFFLNFK